MLNLDLVEKEKYYKQFIGKKINHLFIQNIQHNNLKTACFYFVCLCDCGETKIIRGEDVISGKIKSCNSFYCFRGEDLKKLIGKKYGKLTILSFKKENNERIVTCSCDCGSIKDYKFSNVKRTTNQCGCSSNKGNANNHELKVAKRNATVLEKMKNRIGEKYGFLTIIDIVVASKRKMMKCICECGNVKVCQYTDLTTGRTQSCGCLQKEIATKNILINSYNSTKRLHQWYFNSNDKKTPCRSGYEVLFANYLMENNIKFIYEPEPLIMPNKSTYTPDFYLPKTNEYIELKGYIFSTKQLEKINYLKSKYNIKIYFWDDIYNLCNLKYHSYTNYKKRANKAGMSFADYLALTKLENL